MHFSADDTRDTGFPSVILGDRRVQCHADQQAFVIDEQLIVCTPTQYPLLRLLLTEAGCCVPYERLLACLPDLVPGRVVGRSAARRRLMRPISALRARLWPCGLEIASVVGIGYLLVSLTHTRENHEARRSGQIPAGGRAPRDKENDS